MAERGAPAGNQNAANGKIWRAAILRALSIRSRIRRKEALDEIADALIQKCIDGDVPALKEFGDRIDGKAPAEIHANVSGSLIEVLAGMGRKIGEQPDTADDADADGDDADT